MEGCLAADDFDRPDGAITQASTGQAWATHGLYCDDCHPVFAVSEGQASMAPGPEKNFIWLATIDTGRASGVSVGSAITLSPTPLRANIGLVALFTDRQNYLTCKIEVTEGNPGGLLAIGEQLRGETHSLLADRGDIGLRNGRTYRLELTIPTDPDRQPVRCTVSGPGVRRASVSFRLSPGRVATYGEGTSQGLRIKIYDDEDDGGSRWDDFVVEAL
jgi:hypothetical protein